VGAYSYALLNYHFGLGFWTVLPIGGALGALLFGIMLGFPVLRLAGGLPGHCHPGLRGDYPVDSGKLERFSFGPSGIANIPRPGLVWHRI
jgi:branched-chain amino acid transport system permease protein